MIHDREDAELALVTFRNVVALIEAALLSDDSDALKEAEDAAFYGHGSLRLALGMPVDQGK